MGSPDFAVPSLKGLAATAHSVVAVVTGPDKRRGRGAGTSPTPVKAAALDLKLPVIETDTLRSESVIRQIADLAPDLIVVVAFKILPDSLLKVPRIGSVNAHASLLPNYRGAAPIHHAILNGETETGVTVFLLDRGVDTGGILLQRKTPIGPAETTGDVYDRLSRISAEVLIEAVDRLSEGAVAATPQEDALATTAPKVYAEDGWLDLTLTARVLYNRIRAFTPFPGAWLLLDGRKCRIWSAEVTDVAPASAVDPLMVPTGGGWLRITSLQLEGKTRMDASEFRNGYAGAWVFEGKK